MTYHRDTAFAALVLLCGFFLCILLYCFVWLFVLFSFCMAEKENGNKSMPSIILSTLMLPILTWYSPTCNMIKGSTKIVCMS